MEPEPHCSVGKMNDIVIISSDKVFARMLFLELKKADIQIKVISDTFDIKGIMPTVSNANVVVYDADYLSGDVAFIDQMKVPCVVFSKSKITNLPENVVGFFERPFIVSGFVSCVYSYLTLNSEASENTSKPEKDRLVLDNHFKQAIFEGKTVRLSKKEFSLLSFLYKNRGRVVLRKEVLDAVWGSNYDERNNADNVYISYLRKKLDDAFGVKLIYTVRGKGYMMK